MWDSSIESLNGGRAHHVKILQGSASVTCAQVLRAWQDDEAFRRLFLKLLADAPFAAYRWETPPITIATVAREFEFVLLDAPGLDGAGNTQAFADQFRSARGEGAVLAFPNLGSDALLVVPRPVGSFSAYGHLASFVRHAPESQKHELWRVVGTQVQAQLKQKPLWLSTAGLGVPWLHVRLDSRPKYYGFRAYAVEK